MTKKRFRDLLCIAMVFFWASEYCHAPYFTPYLEGLGFASALIGIMTGVYGFTQIFARIPIGIITDAFSCYKKTILFGTVATTLSSFFLMFATSAWAIITCRVVAGLAASTWLAFTVLYNAYYRDDESVTAMTNVNAFSNGGKLLAFFLGILTASVWGYKIPLLCSFLTGCVSIFAVLLLEPVKIKHESFSFSHVVSVIKTPSIIAVSLLAVMMQFYMQGTVFSFTSGRAAAAGTSSFMIGIISLSFTLIQVITAPYIGKKLLRRISAHTALFGGFMLLAAAALIIGLSGEGLLLAAANILAGIGNLIINGLLMAKVVSSVSEEKRSTAMGFYQAVYGIGMSLGPVAVGSIVSSSGYEAAYFAVAAMMALTAVAAWALIRRFR